MSSASILIIWITCLRLCFSTDSQPTSATEIEQNSTLEDHDTKASNIHLIKIKDSFWPQMLTILNKNDSDKSFEEMQTLLASLNLTIGAYQREAQKRLGAGIRNSTIFRDMLRRQQNSDQSSNEDDESKADAIRSVRMPIDIETVDENESTVERQANVRALNYIYERRKGISRRILSWLSSYCRHPNEPNPQGEGTWIEFANVAMEDVIIAPRGFNWVICSTRHNTNIEILERLNHFSYPTPIRRKAYSTVQPLIRNLAKLNAECVPVEWTDLPVMFFDDKMIPQFTILKNFVSTACSCPYV